MVKNISFLNKSNHPKSSQTTITCLEEKLESVSLFFNAKNITSKIKLWNHISEYKNHLKQYVPKYYDWMIMDTYDKNINVLVYEECIKLPSHKDMTIQQYEKMLIHEIIHSVRQEINCNVKEVDWFWEALATYFAKQYDYVTSVHYKKEELMYRFNDLKFNYEVAFTIVTFMMENYTQEKMLNYVKNPSQLIIDTDQILTEVDQWFNCNFLLLPNIPKVENDDFVIYASDSLEQFAKDTLDILSRNKPAILKFFGISNYKKVQVNLFDNQETFLSFLRNIKPSKNQPPSYCTGTFDNFMINSSINLNDLNNHYLGNLRKNVHEFIHIIYNDCITNKRIIWIDEGLAMNLSKDHNLLDDEERFKEFLKNRILNIENIPNMNELTHGSEFVTKTYNGYDLSYFVVRYMLETLDHTEFQNIIRDNQKTEKIGYSILQDAIQYYKNKYFL